MPEPMRVRAHFVEHLRRPREGRNDRIGNLRQILALFILPPSPRRRKVNDLPADRFRISCKPDIEKAVIDWDENSRLAFRHGFLSRRKSSSSTRSDLQRLCYPNGSPIRGVRDQLRTAVPNFATT